MLKVIILNLSHPLLGSSIHSPLDAAPNLESFLNFCPSPIPRIQSHQQVLPTLPLSRLQAVSTENPCEHECHSACCRE